ncbi:FkbM family methyltransferase [Nocardioides aurantiacus]|uniref:FkbM family methyltransferase n=1 Tax=Nocardioides aurantiacus TaxID=86796 RepID=A0A3N2CXS6_9ACTN|nr:FkbM family methyltransferase [Nocardioides aurantiacus]ROR92331.1 FkbM family methyltransferase [Nocardioides aurantiacus]
MATARELRRTLRHLRFHVRFATRSHVPGARGLLRDYLRLRLLEKVQPGRRRPVEVAGHTVHFTDLATLRWLFREVYLSRDYEVPPEVPVHSIVDAGANIGLATLFFRDRHPDARIVCFEPDPRSYACLVRNLEVNGITGVTAHNTGLAEERGTVVLFVNPAVADSSQSISPSFASSLLDGGTPDRLEIQVAPLAEFLDEPVDLMKLDVEGAELGALRGAGEGLRDVARIYMEYHNVPESPLHEVLEVLAATGHDYAVTSPVRAELGAVTTIRSTRVDDARQRR